MLGSWYFQAQYKFLTEDLLAKASQLFPAEKKTVSLKKREKVLSTDFDEEHFWTLNDTVVIDCSTLLTFRAFCHGFFLWTSV